MTPSPADPTPDTESPGSYVEADGFSRDTNYITTRITADGSDGWPVEPDRYRLVVSRACPWASIASSGWKRATWTAMRQVPAWLTLLDCAGVLSAIAG